VLEIWQDDDGFWWWYEHTNDEAKRGLLDTKQDAVEYYDCRTTTSVVLIRREGM
jgi:hypothetical protein